MLTELLDALIPQTVSECVMEEKCDYTLRQLLAGFLRNEYTAIATDAHRECTAADNAATRNREKHAIAECCKRTVARRLLLMHVMMCMLTNFQSVMVARFVKGVMVRQVAGRLVGLMDRIEERTSHVLQSHMESAIVEHFLLPTLQDEAVDRLRTAALRREVEVDFIEEQFFRLLRSEGG